MSICTSGRRSFERRSRVLGNIDTAAPDVRLAGSTPIADVLDKIFGPPLHEHADPAQRVVGVTALPSDSVVLAQVLGADPSPDVRIAAAARCSDLAALTAALRSEADPNVVAAIAASLGKALATTPDNSAVRNLLAAPECADAVRAQVALHTQDEDRRRVAIETIDDENVLVDVALAADHASARIAAAERVNAPEPLRRLAKGARDKDRGVARLARDRLDAISQRIAAVEAADAILDEAEALVARPGPIVMAAVELDRRWKTLILDVDDARHARWEAVGRLMQQRFDRELEAQRAHAAFEQRLERWLASLDPPPVASALPNLREELLALRTEAANDSDARALAKLQQAEEQIMQWEQAAPALAAAEALVVEAEQLATGTPIDDAQLPSRWQALELAARTPALTRRFEAALLVIEQRRLAYVRANQQEQAAVRQQLHTVLHEAEQALATGQLQQAREAADRVRALKLHAGVLPKPSVQRLSRVVQQLVELERWQQFGQQNARVQLCERAEALVQTSLVPAALAREVQQVRAEWKKLDEQHSGVPRSLWERFDGACERAYAPAARHFAEQAALHKQARKQREDFIELAALHAPTLLGEPRDWRAIERWLRDTESTWRGASLGSVEPGAWKKLDARMKAALAPLHDALSAARRDARQQREALIVEAEALAAKSMDRDTPTKVKELQTRWQAHSKSIVLAQRDERVLWERFRVACNAVFDARRNSRKEAEERRHIQHRTFEALCERLEHLARSTEVNEAQIRQSQREVLDRWRRAVAESGPVPAAIEARFKAARAGVDELLRGRTRHSEAAAWQTLLAKERLCEELDALAIKEEKGEVADPTVADSVKQRWIELPPLATEWEQKMLQRRDASLQALAAEDARFDHVERIEDGVAARRDALLELELMLGIESPADLQAQRLAVQVKQLRDRFKRTASGAGSAQQILIDWCALPGVADPRDRQRCERIVARLERRR
jgi:DNA repair protein SbcC/Rad50